MNSDNHILVTGAGGFIGAWLVRHLIEQGFARVRAVDRKPLGSWYQLRAEAENLVLDLKSAEACRAAVRGVSHVFNLAAELGGIGYITARRADCMLSVLINTNLLVAAREEAVERYFFSSSSCTYNIDKQKSDVPRSLSEEDAYPAMCQDGYGWEKLFSERMCRHFREDFGFETRVARYFNVYGPYETYDGGREKAPGAICRKVAAAVLSGNHEIEIWGDGKQSRSFTFIADCLHGTTAIMDSDITEPINLGTPWSVTIDELVDIVEGIAGVKLKRRYIRDAPMGVRGRQANSARLRQALAWEPATTLEEGLEPTYRWIYDQLASDSPDQRYIYR